VEYSGPVEQIRNSMPLKTLGKMTSFPAGASYLVLLATCLSEILGYTLHIEFITC